MSEIKGDYYPRMNALLQEDEIKKLQVRVNLLLTENAALKEKLAQYEQGRPMSEAPLDGTQILCEIKDRFGVHYEIIEWNEEVNFWTGSVFDYQPMYKPNDNHDEYLSRWWPLPGGEK